MAITVLCIGIPLHADPADSLRLQLERTESDSAKIRILLELSALYTADSAGRASDYATAAIEVSEKLGSRIHLGKSYTALGTALTRMGELDAAKDAHEQSIQHFAAIGDSAAIIEAVWRIGSIQSSQGRYAFAIEQTLTVLRFHERNNDSAGIIRAVLQLGHYHQRSRRTRRALEYLERAETLLPASPLTAQHMRLHGTLGMCFQDMGDDRRAIHYFRRALDAKHASREQGYQGYYHRYIAASYLNLGVYDSAETYGKEALRLSEVQLMPQDIVACIIVLAKIRYAKGEYRDALAALSGALPLAQRIGANAEIYEALDLLSRTHAALRDYRNAFEYSVQAAAYKDTLFSVESSARISEIEDRFSLEKFREQQKAEKALQDEQLRNAALVRNAAIAGLILIALLAAVLYNRFRYRDKTSRQLKRAYDDLKATQEQLLQSEQLASLGQLTAGIAHEIKNPLNFVNNFSSISVELCEELETELRDPAETDRANVVALLSDLKQNLAKIEEHGVRADRIVKTMMLHARKEGSEKQPVDVNLLVSDAAELAWHSARASGLDTQVDIVKNFAADTGEVDAHPQELSRVILNLIQNALYAVAEKERTAAPDYAAIITLTTLRTEEAVVLKCADNGSGIPKDVQERIFTPFFTTKPVGEGTGLGLALAFDIVVKAHRGTLTFKSTPGEGTEFVVTIPLGGEE